MRERVMLKVKASSKGQVVIPKSVRAALSIKAGTELEVSQHGNAVTFRVAAPEKRYTIDDLIGCLPYSGPPKTIAEMDKGIEEAVLERWERKKG
jgi:AbrB family looped-hinge helix DNA binding protein